MYIVCMPPSQFTSSIAYRKYKSSSVRFLKQMLTRFVYVCMYIYIWYVCVCNVCLSVCMFHFVFVFRDVYAFHCVLECIVFRIVCFLLHFI